MPNRLRYNDEPVTGTTGGVHDVEVRPMTDLEVLDERLSLDQRDPWLASCSCGARMLPLLPGEANAWAQGHLGTKPR